MVLMPLWSNVANEYDSQLSQQTCEGLNKNGIASCVVRRGEPAILLLIVDAPGETLDARLRWLEELENRGEAWAEEAAHLAVRQWPRLVVWLGEDPAVVGLLKDLHPMWGGGRIEVTWPRLVEALCRLNENAEAELRSRAWMPLAQGAADSRSRLEEVSRALEAAGVATHIACNGAPSRERLFLLVDLPGQPSLDGLIDGAFALAAKMPETQGKLLIEMAARLEPPAYVHRGPTTECRAYFEDPRFANALRVCTGIGEDGDLASIEVASRQVVPFLDAIDPDWRAQLPQS